MKPQPSVENLDLYNEHTGLQYFKPRNMAFKDINPRDAGFQQCLPGFGEPPHKRWYYVFHYVVSGEGYLRVEDKEYNLRRGQVFLIRPNIEITYHASENNPWSYIWVGFDGEFAHTLDDIDKDIFNLNSELFDQIKEAIKYKNMRSVYLAGCIYNILAAILENTQEPNVISTIKSYINSDTLFNSNITELAKLVNLSPDHLTKIFKQETGITLIEYIINKKMKLAKKLLNSDYTTSEVAQMVGYSDNATFSRAYKKFYGYPPSRQKQANAAHIESQTPHNKEANQ